MTSVSPLETHKNADSVGGNANTSGIKKDDIELTDAFGEVEFQPDKTAKYVRVSDETPVKDLYQSLTKNWGLELPNFIISVTGGAENFTLTPRMTDMFRKSLIKAAEKTGAWITTGGTHTGVMKHVGKAVKNYAAICDDKEKVVTIGIATWGVIFERDKLKDGGGKDNAKQYNPDEGRRGFLAVLDYNHSHFILVDDGKEGTNTDAKDNIPFGGEIKLRTELEDHIAQLVGQKRKKENTEGKENTECKEKTSGKQKLNTREKRIVCVILQGGPGSLQTVYKSIKKKTPVVVIEGSGGFADVLAEASKMDVEKLTDETVKELLEAHKIEKQGNKLPKLIKKVKKCVQNEDKTLLSVFKFDPTNTSKDLDFAILEALLKANYNDDQPEEKLKLVLEWNRSDIARSLILNDDTHLSKADIIECFSQALELNKPDFCKALLEYGVDVKSLWTVRRLKSLYGPMLEKTMPYKKLSKIESKKFSLLNIGKIMRRFMDNSYVNIYNGKPGKYSAVLDLRTKDENSSDKHVEFQDGALLDDPYREIFQWAILAGRRDIARYIWEYMFESIPAAVVATKILKEQASQTSDHDCKNALEADAAEYEKLAVGVLGRCFEKNPKDTTKLLVRTLKKWGGYTCLDIAIKADDKLFVSSPAVQHHFDEVWMGSLRGDTQTFVSQPLESGADVESQHNKDPAAYREENKRKKSVLYQNLKQVNWPYSAPVVTFWLNVVSFLAYLFLFASVLLSSFTEVVSDMEYFLVFWLSTFALEEIREIVGENERHFKDKIIIHIRSLWNIMDISSHILFYIAFGLRTNSSLDAALLLYCICFMIQCVRIVHIFTVHPFLGPKIIMVRRMIKDLLFFLFFLVVFLLAYGVASQALLYPNESNIGDIIVGIIYKPYWNIYGELFLDEINYNPNADDFTCSNDEAAGLPRCPQKHVAVPILSAVYLLFVNVLLLNLLIAMFSYTFDKVERQGNEIWKFQRYSLITDYYYKPKLPPPLIVFCHIWRLATELMKKKLDNTSDEKPKSEFKNHLKPEEEKRLNRWERWHAEAFLQESFQNDKFKPENQLSNINDRFESLTSRVENLQGSLERSMALVMKKLENLEASNSQTMVQPEPSARF